MARSTLGKRRQSANFMLGPSDFQRELLQVLAKRAMDPSATRRISIIHTWSDIASLSRTIEHSRAPVMLVEDAGNGHVALGPLFAPESRGCFRCYLARRRANGAQECRPASRFAPQLLDQTADELARFLDGRSTLFSEQVEI